ncbi:hypothetical protein BN874_1100019 [Candidatus Contendobacter odensis Run_B_J11]|uniref:Uncharacterized protein n=1 Tax=Candidatus Contendobacter odensis Run_B_J11 TaxID=1400861 RepID=A0A7U7J2A5_9GAMM|nr:hypothetical protein BN874_1100019 [Candidatus Contendobacter odensis Run_B_J11]
MSVAGNRITSQFAPRSVIGHAFYH